jgi:hypothetical protein
LNPHVARGLSDTRIGTRMLEHLSWPHATADELSCDVPQPLLQAWNAALREWDWRGPATLDRNVGAIRRHYHVGKAISNVPPAGLTEDWRRDRWPDPTAWIEAKLLAILGDQPQGDVA